MGRLGPAARGHAEDTDGVTQQRRREEPVVVTSAYESRIADVNARRRHYAVTMISRILLVGLAVAFLRPWPWALYPSMAVALVLPYFAVVMANISNRKAGQAERFEHGGRGVGALDAGAVSAPTGAAQPPTTPVSGFLEASDRPH